MKTDTVLYNHIGEGYNLTRRADPYLGNRLFALLQPVSVKTYLDIGCGTGNYTCMLSQGGIQFYGIDPSEKMLQEAQGKSAQVKWLQGRAEDIPLPDQYFDGAMGTLTIHHWSNLQAGFAELWRVLKPAAKLVLFTATPPQMQQYWLCHYFPKMLKDSAAVMPAPELVEEAANKAGFSLAQTEPYHVQSDLQDLFLYSGKHNPELYFNEKVRKGISSFAALAHTVEVQRGLAQLRADLDSGHFAEIRRQYDDSLGDYLFMVFEK